MKGEWKQNVPLFHKESRRKRQPKRKSFLKDNYWHLRNIEDSNEVSFKTEIETTINHTIPTKTELRQIYLVTYEKRSDRFSVHPTEGYLVYEYDVKIDKGLRVGDDYIVYEPDGNFKYRIDAYQVRSTILLETYYDVISGYSKIKTFKESFVPILKGKLIQKFERYSDVVYKRGSDKYYQKMVNGKDRALTRNWINSQDFSLWVNHDIDLLTAQDAMYDWEYEFFQREFILENETRDNIGIGDIPTHEYSKSLSWLKY